MHHYDPNLMTIDALVRACLFVIWGVFLGAGGRFVVAEFLRWRRNRRSGVCRFVHDSGSVMTVPTNIGAEELERVCIRLNEARWKRE